MIELKGVAHFSIPVSDVDKSIKFYTEVVGCRGHDRLEGLNLKNLETGTLTEVESGFLFVFIGAAPRTDWLGDRVARDAHGFIVTGDRRHHRVENTPELQAWVLLVAEQIREARRQVERVIPVNQSPAKCRACGMRTGCGQRRA